MIKNDNEFAGDKNEFDEFMHDADTIGVKVNLTGTLPKNEELIHAFILAMRECLTNCVRHANATEIYITMVQNESTATLQITNNGLVPQNPITAKGGLKNLEHYISKLQGTMEIQWSPTFMLTIAMPLTKEET